MAMQLRNTSTNEIIQLCDGLTLGRHQSCGYVVDDNSVSRVHAKIEWKNEAFSLTDQKSSNGSFVDGRKQNIIRLHGGILVRLGEVEFGVVDESQSAEQEDITNRQDRQESARQRREIIEEQTGGLGDLSQQPFAIRALAFALGLGVMLGVIYLVRKAGEVF
jgi:pSer/pThr/pTyr-binding forkhead associated (FHA) protein